MTKGKAPARRGQRGSVTPVALACMALALLLCLCLTDVGLFLSARTTAQNAADAAALAAARESFPLCSTGKGAREAAGRMAGLNSASLESLKESAGGRVEVEVSVRSPSLLLRRLGISPGTVKARAAAEVDIERLLASEGIWYTADPAAVTRLRQTLAGARDAQGAAGLVALFALTHLGKPYRWAAAGPNSFDCSGLVCYVFAQLGVGLPRVTFAQVRCGRPVAPAQLEPGDLVFFRQNAHVGIYIGSGSFVHAPRTGDVVKVSSLSARSDLSACRRIL